MPMDTCVQNEFRISTDPSEFDLVAIHAYLTTSYWAKGISKDLVARSIKYAICFGVFAGANQIGFARVITDHATFAYIGDLYILDAYQRRGLGKWLMECIVNHPELQGLRRWSLVTRDAHGLYEQFGFRPLDKPQGYMERSDIISYADPGGDMSRNA